MNISGISGIGTQPIFQPVSPPAHGRADATRQDFGDLLKSAVDSVDKTQGESAASIEQLLTGKQQDVLPVVAAVAKADISFKLLLGVRNKMIEAYKQTMNMQV